MAPTDTPAAQAGATAQATPQAVRIAQPRSEREQVMDFLFAQCEVKNQILSQQAQQLQQLQNDLQKTTQDLVKAQEKVAELQGVIDKLRTPVAPTPAPAITTEESPAAPGTQA